MIAAAPKNKRPGEAATSSEPKFSAYPLEGNAMNVHSNITAAPAPATDRMTATRALIEFEGPIRDAHRMAYILAELLEDNLRDFRMVGGIRPDDDTWHIRLTRNEMGILGFAWNDVVNRLDALERLFDETWDRARSERHDASDLRILDDITALEQRLAKLKEARI